jgi:hypothetical protein
MTSFRVSSDFSLNNCFVSNISSPVYHWYWNSYLKTEIYNQKIRIPTVRIELYISLVPKTIKNIAIYFTRRRSNNSKVFADWCGQFGRRCMAVICSEQLAKVRNYSLDGAERHVNEQHFSANISKHTLRWVVFAFAFACVCYFIRARIWQRESRR